jgi:hypothetical protein
MMWPAQVIIQSRSWGAGHPRVLGTKKGHTLVALQCDNPRALTSKSHMCVVQKEATRAWYFNTSALGQSHWRGRRRRGMALQLRRSRCVYNSFTRYFRTYSDSLTLIHMQHAEHDLSDGETIASIVIYSQDHMQIHENVVNHCMCCVSKDGECGEAAR